MKKAFCSTFLLFFLSTTGLAGEDNARTRVLFVGNSYTYYHSMPQLFRAMAEHHFPDHEIEVKFIGRGGITLKEHWNEGNAIEEIRSGRWDYVVLQEQSMLGGEIIENGKSYVRSPAQFFEYAEKFSVAIREKDADPVFFMTWSRKGFPQQQKYLTYAYMNIAEKTESVLAPVGVVWDKLRSNHQFDMYEKDGSHPSVYGSYTAALMLFSVIFDTDPTGIPGRLKGYEILRGGIISNKMILLCDLPENEKRIIQSVVSGIFHHLKKENGYFEVVRAVSNKKPSPFTKILDFLSDARGQFIILISIAGLFLVVKGGILLFKK